ncbi:hypothetical protein BD309DRAFT_852760 [Dichomitus squalens]|uniref:Protein CPL1-like domain-containing protein n=1 Tax=Dichomitus squalens TaxID=114155 RepID=A0A4Q9P877_9APHY|nr:hypothetical protein BD309DRAFT_852760 [Dichomitus squalens]TBU59273.1 hypothetical protein BD310DRAFT_948046 [Dichomitus squalens]
MYSTPALLALVASFGPLIWARSIPSHSRYRGYSAEHSVASVSYLRNHPRQSSQDTCVYINSTTLSSLAVPGSLSDTLATLNSCMCVNSLPSLLQSNLEASYLLGTTSLSIMEQALGTYITDSPYSQTCIYPANSQPMCSADNVCGFSCTPPYTVTGDQCVLQEMERRTHESAPLIAYRKKTWRLVKRAEAPEVMIAQSTCASHESVCDDVDGPVNGFQCIDVKTSPDSCGGCTVQSPLGDRSGSGPAGVNCTAISHADAVSCASGKCAIHTCLAGWSVNDEGTGCIEDQNTANASTLSRDQSTLSMPSRRGLPYQPQQNDSRTAPVKPHADWVRRVLNIRSMQKREDQHVQVSNFDLESDHTDGVTRVGSKHINADWTRIPDYRRYLIV